MINMILIGLRLRGADNLESISKCQRANNDIVFAEADLQGVQTLHNDVVVVPMTIANYDVKWCLVDNESSTDVIFYDCLSQMRLSSNLIKPVNIPWVAFTGDSIKIEGEIELFVTVGQPFR